MRIFLLFFPVFFFCGLLHAQTVKVEYGGDPLPDKDRKKIEQFLQHEVDFYSQFGLPDTLSLQLYVFENRREAIDYLEVSMCLCLSRQVVHTHLSYKRQSS